MGAQGAEYKKRGQECRLATRDGDRKQEMGLAPEKTQDRRGFRESFPLVATCQGKEAAKTRGLGWARGWVLVLLGKIQQVP